MAMTVVEPKGKGVLLLDSHPDGCRRTVEAAAAEVPAIAPSPAAGRRALIIGASAGYGMAITVAGLKGLGIAGMGLALERPATARRTASAGWYRVAAAKDVAREPFDFVNGDCFDPATKDEVLSRFAEKYGQIDYLIYSVAAPRRVQGDTTYQSVIKPIGVSHATYSLDVDGMTPALRRVEIGPAGEDEIASTVKVMGGEDWAQWIAEADRRGLVAEGFQTVALSYIGSELTAPIYRHGTIGRAKDHLERTARGLTDDILSKHGGSAVTSVNGAAVTQASTAIPGIGLYVSLLHDVLQDRMQSPVRQAVRLWQHLTGEVPLDRDEHGRIRLDDWEFAPGVQQDVRTAWESAIAEGKVSQGAAEWFFGEVYRLYGFGVQGVDYAAPTEV
jgi:enoyl-[acyl-carrier protein] reductase/trans-2-enoyl-CoA reductase (NAD+)